MIFELLARTIGVGRMMSTANDAMLLFLGIAAIAAALSYFAALVFRPSRWRNVLRFAIIAGLSTLIVTTILIYSDSISRTDIVDFWFFVLNQALFFGLIWGFVPTLLGAALAVRRSDTPRKTTGELFEVSVSVPSVGKTVALEVAPNHSVGSLVETLTSTLELPSGRAYAIEYAGTLISQQDFGKTLGALGIREGSKLGLRVEE